MCTCARLLLSMVLLLASSTNPTGVASEGKRVSPNLNSLPFIKNEKKKKKANFINTLFASAIIRRFAEKKNYQVEWIFMVRKLNERAEQLQTNRPYSCTSY